MYTPVHVHSYFTLGRGCLSPEEICRQARERGFPAAGMTDTDNFYGLVRFLLAAGREGIKPLAGAVLTRQDPEGAARAAAAPLSPSGTCRAGRKELCTAFVLNRRGFSRLAEILTERERTDPLAGLLDRGWEGLALACEDWEVLQRLARRERAGLYAKLVYGKSFGRLARAARAAALPLCAVNDAYYVEQRDAGICDLLAAASRNCLLDDLDPGDRLAPLHRLAGAQEIERFFSAVPEALENAWRLAQEADTRGILSERFVFPQFEGLTEGEAFRRLKALCLQGAARRYGPTCGARRHPPASSAAERPWMDRLDYELGVISAKGFSSYFLVVQDIVAQCPRTCGRGSSAASIVSYLIGITHVDPLRYNLFFERFLNMDRQDPPDIDVDFPWDERDKALRYVFERYPGRSGMVADHVTYGPRSALREPAKALGLPEGEIKKMVRFYRHGELARIPPYLALAAQRIRGFPRYLGTHPGGVVITPEPITRYTHVQTSPLGYPVIAWEKDATEDAGLVKIDLLGNRSLGVLRDTIALVNRRHGTGLSWEGLDPLDSAETRELIAAGRTLGIFYVESPATRQLLQKMRTGDFERLIIASSIIRPAANRYIQEFVRRLHGAPYAALTPRLEETLKETYGIMVYQEDVSRVVIDAAGFSPGEADQLRKILSKKDRERRLPDYRQKLFQRGGERGIPRRTLERIWDMILSFEGYSFCKAHSASYALVSYKLAWLKRFHPLEFFASVINNGGGFYSRQTYLDECRRLGFRILPPDVNCSRLAYTVEQGALRVGLAQLKDVDLGFLSRIIAEREGRGPYADFPDFLARLSPGLPEVRVLIRSGALDGLAGALSRPQLFWLYLRLQRDGGLFLAPPVPKGIGDYPENIKLLDEVRTLGLMISRHPLTVFRERVRRLAGSGGFPALIDSSEIPAWKGRQVTLAGLLVTGKEVITRKREPMVFVSFEDEHSVFETVFFPEAFRKFYSLIDGGGVFLICGRVEEDLGALSVHVERARRLDRRSEDSDESVFSSISGGLWGMYPSPWEGQPA